MDTWPLVCETLSDLSVAVSTLKWGAIFQLQNHHQTFFSVSSDNVFVLSFS